MSRRAEARAAAREAGAVPRSRFPTPDVPRGAGDKVLRAREENRKKLAETEKKDAAT
jgi:hypothetical protein